MTQKIVTPANFFLYDKTFLTKKYFGFFDAKFFEYVVGCFSNKLAHGATRVLIKILLNLVKIAMSYRNLSFINIKKKI
jgi:hypothetical protein